MGAEDGDNVGGGGVWGSVRSGRAAADKAGALSAPLGGCLTTEVLHASRGPRPGKVLDISQSRKNEPKKNP